MTTNDDEENETPKRLRWLLTFAGVLAFTAVIVWWPGCRQYPAVTSPEALQLSKLLYSACTGHIEKLTVEGKMTAVEKVSFEKILGLARSGDWKAAEDAAFKFSQDQVGQGTTKPKP